MSLACCVEALGELLIAEGLLNFGQRRFGNVCYPERSSEREYEFEYELDSTHLLRFSACNDLMCFMATSMDTLRAVSMRNNSFRSP